MTAVERQRDALELRKSGLSYDAIATRLGYAHASGAHKAVTLALKRTIQEPADELRRVEVERLDAALSAIWKKVLSGDTWAIDRMLKIMERRAALLGLDAPQRREVTGKDGGPMRHEHSGPDFSALTMEEQFALDQMLAKVEAPR